VDGFCRASSEAVPEGPEIRRAADRVAAAVEGRRARRVFFAFDRLKRFEAKLQGRRVRRVEARGKACLVHFAGGWTVYSHNQLYGRWFVRPDSRRPRTGRSLRFAVSTSERSALLYSASDIEVLRADELESHPYLARLGPDPLLSTTTADVVRAHLDTRRFQRRSLATLLLDQSFLAGVGNYLRSEILYFSRLHPRRRPAEPGQPEASRLALAVLTIPRRSYRSGGVTVPPRLAARLRRQGLARPAYRHAVFGREGRPCWWCATPVERRELAGRRLYLCPTCQPREGSA
jgi:endonuclease-8